MQHALLDAVITLKGSPMPSRAPVSIIRVFIVLMSGLLLVHATSGEGVGQTANQTAKSKKTPDAPIAAKAKSGATELPIAVGEMRDGILAAVKSGRIEDLLVPIAWNELPPTFAAEPTPDPIAYWKKLSGDGEGREILAVLAGLFDAGFTVLPVGRDVENSRLYVWPRFAEMPLDKLSSEDEVQLYRITTPALLKSMREKKRWIGWRLTIGADGTWHSFNKID